jgi:hypothetical protein
MLRTALETSTSDLDMLLGLGDSLSCRNSNLALAHWHCGFGQGHQEGHMPRLHEYYLATQWA